MPPSASSRADPRPRRLDVARNGRHAGRKKAAGDRVEFDHVEEVAGLEAAERQAERGFRLADRFARHRARGVDDEIRLARQVEIGAPFVSRRRQEHEQGVGGAIDLWPRRAGSPAAWRRPPGAHSSTKSRSAGTAPAARVTE